MLHSANAILQFASTKGRLDHLSALCHLNPMLIYKILQNAEWERFQADGRFDGAPIDLSDGYIHFSTGEQAVETAAKHFAQATGLWLACVEAEPLGEALKWEPSRGGALFPHLYAALSMTSVLWCKPLPLGADGHIFPDLAS